MAYLMDALDPQWKDDPGMKAFDEFLARDFPEGNRADSIGDDRLQHGSDAGPRAETVRRRSHARERHEAGREPEGLQDHKSAARHYDQHERNRLRADQAGAAQEIKGERWELFGPMLSSEIGG